MHFHRWSKWGTPYDTTWEVTKAPLAPHTIGTQFTKAMQRRSCDRCGKVQERKLLDQ